MKNYPILIRVIFLVSVVSLIIGIVGKLMYTSIMYVTPLSYLRFTGICLMYIIALNLTEISLKK